MLSYEAHSAASPRVAWALLARPARWREWAPGRTVGVDLHAAAPVEAALRVSYGPVVAAPMGRLARVAERN